jgi:hypothetical protein
MRAFLVLVLAAGTLAGCHKKCQDPQPGCVSGIIVANTCVDGPLINVDARYHIGAPGVLAGGQQLGRNVIAVVNRDVLGRIDSIGQRVYFTYTSDPDRQWNGMCCFAFDGTQQPVPHLVLSNVSATGCQGQPAH